MSTANTIATWVGLVLSAASLVVGIISLINTTLIKRKQIMEIEAAKEIAIFNSDMPRAAIIERPNDSGKGLVFVPIENNEGLLDYLRDHPNERIAPKDYKSCKYNKIEILSILNNYEE